jgi:GNAT superfamily N-acetyltransferase
MRGVSGVHFDAGALESVAQLFRREIWRTPPPDAIAECGIEVQSFGPLQATVFAELGELETANLITGAAEPGAVADGHLADAIEWAGSRGVDYCVAVAEGRPGSGEAEDWLNRSCYEQDGSRMTFVRDVDPSDLPEMPGIEILELREGEGEGMSGIAAEGLGLPEWAGTLFFDLPSRSRWRCYVALLDGELAACGAMMVEDGIAELGVDATRPPARGRGCQLSLLRHRIEVARELGCKTLFAEVGCNVGSVAITRSNLLHAAFEEGFRSRVWHLSPSLGIY